MSDTISSDEATFRANVNDYFNSLPTYPTEYSAAIQAWVVRQSFGRERPELATDIAEKLIAEHSRKPLCSYTDEELKAAATEYADAYYGLIRPIRVINGLEGINNCYLTKRERKRYYRVILSVNPPVSSFTRAQIRVLLNNYFELLPEYPEESDHEVVGFFSEATQAERILLFDVMNNLLAEHEGLPDCSMSDELIMEKTRELMEEDDSITLEDVIESRYDVGY